MATQIKWVFGFRASSVRVNLTFLKILAYLLENKKVKEKQAIDFFDDKVEDPLVYRQYAANSKCRY